MLQKPPDLKKLASALEMAEVEYVLIGGLALVAHGVVRPTFDMDLAVAFSQENRKRVAEALRPLNPHPQRMTPNEHFVWDELWIRAPWSVFQTDAGRVDVIVSLPGVDSFAGLYERSFQFDYLGSSVRVASLGDMIAMKSAANRLRDKADLAELQAIQELLQPGGTA